VLLRLGGASHPGHHLRVAGLGASAGAAAAGFNHTAAAAHTEPLCTQPPRHSDSVTVRAQDSLGGNARTVMVGELAPENPGIAPPN
jgi:hypothetical protein